MLNGHWSICCSSSSGFVTSPYELKIIEWDKYWMRLFMASQPNIAYVRVNHSCYSICITFFIFWPTCMCHFDWSIACWLNVLTRYFSHLYGDMSYRWWKAAVNLGLFSAFITFEQRVLCRATPALSRDLGVSVSGEGTPRFAILERDNYYSF